MEVVSEVLILLVFELCFVVVNQVGYLEVEVIVVVCRLYNLSEFLDLLLEFLFVFFFELVVLKGFHFIIQNLAFNDTH